MSVSFFFLLYLLLYLLLYSVSQAHVSDPALSPLMLLNFYRLRVTTVCQEIETGPQTILQFPHSLHVGRWH